MIECPYCEKVHDSGDYPDHEAGDTIECGGGEPPGDAGCGNTFLIEVIDWEPVYYTAKIEDA